MRASEELPRTHTSPHPQANILLKYTFLQSRTDTEESCILKINAYWLSVFNHESLYGLCALYCIIFLPQKSRK